MPKAPKKKTTDRPKCVSLPLGTSGTNGTEKIEGTYRRWVMTIFDQDGSRRQNLETLPMYVKYLAYGDEVTKEGKKHYQCFVYTDKIRWSQFASWIGKSYRAPMRGTFKDNEEYCSKQSALKEFGERPDQGRRTDLLNAKAKLEECPGQNIYDIAEDPEFFMTIARHSRFMEGYHNNFHGKRLSNNSPVEVTYVYGPPGSHKTRYVRELEPDVYDVPPHDGYKWKDNYRGNEAVLYDNIAPKNFSPTMLLKEIDRYKIQVAAKGRYIWWKPKRVYITSVHEANEIAQCFSHPNEFLRRITVFKECHPPQDECPTNDADQPANPAVGNGDIVGGTVG